MIHPPQPGCEYWIRYEDGYSFVSLELYEMHPFRRQTPEEIAEYMSGRPSSGVSVVGDEVHGIEEVDGVLVNFRYQLRVPDDDEFDTFIHMVNLMNSLERLEIAANRLPSATYSGGGFDTVASHYNYASKPKSDLTAPTADPTASLIYRPLKVSSDTDGNT